MAVKSKTALERVEHRPALPKLFGLDTLVTSA
jgi:hypothetical protein